MQNELVDRRKNLSGDPLRVLPRTSWQKNRKFVATQAGPVSFGRKCVFKDARCAEAPRRQQRAHLCR